MVVADRLIEARQAALWGEGLAACQRVAMAASKGLATHGSARAWQQYLSLAAAGEQLFSANRKHSSTLQPCTLLMGSTAMQTAHKHRSQQPPTLLIDLTAKRRPVRRSVHSRTTPKLPAPSTAPRE